MGFVHPINLQFASGGNSATQISELLSSWGFWHWVRLLFGAGAFLSLIRAAGLGGRAAAAAGDSPQVRATV
jgi:hypothetical protein